MIVLDGTIVGVVLPTIIDDLGLDLTSAQWITSLYAMVFAALLLTFGRVADRIGRRTVFMVGVSASSALRWRTPSPLASPTRPGWLS